MPRSLLGLFAALFFAVGFAAPTEARTPQPSATATPVEFPSAHAFVVMDVDSGRVLFAQNADQRMYPASTTKAMTALVAIENAPLDKQIRASKKAAETGESSIYLLEGEQHPLSDYLKAALLRSANDACIAIAEGVAGSEEKFIEKMNAKAREVGANNTHFFNPHGLHHERHYTTARDLALIGRVAAQNPTLSRIAAMEKAQIGGNWKLGAERTVFNRNRLLHKWPLCDGLKTGYTRQAGHCLVATATKTDPATGRKWRLLSVVLKSKAGRAGADSQWLLTEAFRKFTPVKLADAGQVMWEGPISGGAAPLLAQTRDELKIPLPQNAGAPKMTPRVALDPKLRAPIEPNQLVGRVEFVSAGSAGAPVAELPLYARSEVPQTLLARALPSPDGSRILPLGVAAAMGLAAFCALGAVWSLLRAKRRRRARRVKLPRASTGSSARNSGGASANTTSAKRKAAHTSSHGKSSPAPQRRRQLD